MNQTMRLVFVILSLLLLCITFIYIYKTNVLENIVSILDNNLNTNVINRKTGLDNRPLCTHHVLREYYKSDRYYPSDGSWNMTVNSPIYNMKLCRFKYNEYPKHLLGKCFNKANISSLATFGDSNGIRHKNALLGFIGAIGGGGCKRLAGENMLSQGFFPDKAYYAPSDQPWAKYVEAQRRTCRSCGGERFKCHVTSDGQSRDIRVEHVTYVQIMDTTVTIPENATNGTLSAPTTQEFYFKYFMKGKFPDLLILYLPFNHAMEKALDVHLNEIQAMRHLVKIYVPKTTKVFFMPAFSEFHKRYKKGYKRINGLMRNDRVEMLNRGLFGVLENDLLEETSNIYGFIDIFTISKSLISWSTDGIHMSGKWYKVEMSMFLELFCNSVLNDQM